MKKRAIFLVLLALLGGLGCGALRWQELHTIFEADTGLAKLWEPVTICIIAAFAAIGAITLIVCGSAGQRQPAPRHELAFHAGGGYFVFSLVLALVMVAGGVLYGVDILDRAAQPVTEWILAACLVVTGVGMLLLAKSAYTQRPGTGQAAGGVLAVLSACYWLVIAYNEQAADPVLLDYVYRLVGIGCTALALYYETGFAFGRVRPWRRTLFFGVLGPAMLLATLVDDLPLGMRLFQGALALAVLANTWAFGKNLQPQGDLQQ